MTFATKFVCHDRQTAENDYRALTDNIKLTHARRQRLFANLAAFNANRADGFWAKRAVIAQADVLAMRVAAVSMEVGHLQSKVIYQKYLPPQGVVESDEDEAEDGTEGEAEDEAGTEDEDEYEDKTDAEDEDRSSADEAEEDFFNDEEISSLLTNIAKAQHPICTWKSEDTCIACLFQQYQRECVQALQDNRLRKADIADVIRKGSQKVKVGIEDCRQVYKEMQFKGTASQAQDRATKFVRHAIGQHADGIINTLVENKDESVQTVTQCMLQNKPLKRPQQDAPSQVPAKKIASGVAWDTIEIDNDLLSTGNATVGSPAINELQALAHNVSSAETPSDEDEVIVHLWKRIFESLWVLFLMLTTS
ncbi:hypothetical protein BGX30_000444 [Mortierella sp. GBA39]|nr:hypothetical protein BGX30_000444 [Mortierella sp. GBA39]